MPPSRIPTRLSTFIGRSRELADLRRLIGHTRLITLIGPGGAGKTRLATELAHQLEKGYRDGADFVDLSVVRDSAVVVGAVARAMGAGAQGGEDREALLRQLADRQLLVVLDNCEHLVAEVAVLTAEILTTCPGISVIATSRERLNIEGELCWGVPPMTLPPESGPIRDGDSDALRLFVGRARQVRPEFMLDGANLGAVTAICRRLEGMPLAIELAAARMIAMTPADLLPRLQDRLGTLTDGARNLAERQQTLRGTIDWGYNLLSDNERVLLRRMSVFAGDHDAATIESVCGAPPLNGPVLRLVLERLAEKSMVQVRQEGRLMVYRLLETVREFAAEKLGESGESNATRARHLAHYRALASAAFEARRVRGALPEHRRLWREIEDVRAALAAAQDSDPATHIDMLGCLGWVWMMYAPEEGRQRIGAILPGVMPLPVPTWYKAAEAFLAISGRSGDHSQEAIYGPAILEYEREVGDLHALGRYELGMGFIDERVRGDLPAARARMLAGVDLLERAGNGPELALAMQSLGSVERQLGNVAAARDWIVRSIALARQVEDPYNEVGSHFHLGWLELDHGTPKAAIAAFAAGLGVAEDSDLLSIAHQLEGLAAALAATDPGAAATMFGAAEKMRARLASPLFDPWRRRAEAGMTSASTELGPEAWERAHGEGAEMSLPQLREVVRRATSRRRAPATPAGGLSRREREIAQLVAAGMTNRAIGEKLFLAERTIESHVEHIRTKLQVNSRAQIATWVSGREL